MDTKALRLKILDLAIRGKLVSQDPNDEPASVLLERIREQKKQMVKEGKLKAKDIKNDSVIFVGEDNLHYEKFADGRAKCIEDEIPFEVPEGWAWSRLHSLTIKIGAGSTPTGGAAVYTTSGIKFVRSQNVYDDGLILDDVAYISEEINQKKSGSIVKPKDILLNITGGSIGRCALVPDDFDIANVNQHVMIIRLSNLELRKYIHSVITSPYIQEQIMSRQVGSGRGGLSAETLSTFLIPLPPLNEQKSIIGKLNYCISKVLTITDEQCNITDLISKSKSKILDLAIRGQLVPQNPDDEPASVLLEYIRAEKEELIRQGKIKRDKKESIIFKGEDNSYYEIIKGKKYALTEELPFDIPDNWTWVRFSTITINRDSERKPISSSQRTDIAKIYDYYGASGKIDKVDEFIFDEKLLLIGEDGANLVTRSKPIAFFAEGKYWVNNHAHCIDATDKFVLEYLCLFINAINLEEYVTGSAQPKMTQDNMNSILISLPPYNEQKRILEQIYKIESTLKIISDIL